MVELDSKSIERFWSRVKKTESCWNWDNPMSHGYGIFAYERKGKRKVYRVHRLSWMLVNGEIPEGYVVCHKCDNPSCVRPDHLFVGTQKENILDMREKGRAKFQNNKKLDFEKATEIRRLREEEILSYRQLAKKFNVNKRTIISIIQNKTWLKKVKI